MDLERQRNKQLKTVLRSYLDGKASDAEKKAIDAWYASFEEDAMDAGESFNRDEVYRQLISGIEQQWPAHIHKVNTERVLWYRIASAAAILIFAVAGVLYFNSNKANPPAQQVVSTLNGAHKTITLPDGSVVELNGHSKLIIAANFNEHDRQVKLEGEAFFDVAKNPRKPFIISSGVLKTEVKGTSFDIRAYHDLDHIKVSVATGIVKVIKSIPGANPSVLTPGIIRNQTLTYNVKTGKGLVKDESILDICSWRNNVLMIDNYTLPEIATILSRHFYRKVKLEPGIPTGRHYTMKMNNPSLSHALNVLSALTKHQFVFNNNQIMITP